MSFFQPRKSATSEVSILTNENYLPPPLPEDVELTRKIKMEEWDERNRLHETYKDQRAFVPPPFFGKVPVGQVNPFIPYKHAEASPWFAFHGTSRGVSATLIFTSDLPSHSSSGRLLLIVAVPSGCKLVARGRPFPRFPGSSGLRTGYTSRIESSGQTGRATLSLPRLSANTPGLWRRGGRSIAGSRRPGMRQGTPLMSRGTPS